MSPEIVALQELQVRRRFHISMVNKQTNAAGALVRRFCGFETDNSEEDREAAVKRSAKIMKALRDGKELDESDREVGNGVAFEVALLCQGIDPYETARHNVELDMKRIVRKLPIAAWAKAVQGLGELAVAVIIGESGDVGSYREDWLLHKRLGLAPFNGRSAKAWAIDDWREGDKKLTAEEWTRVGYSPRRRAEIHSCVSDPLFRRQTVVAGPYRSIYDARREKTSVTHPGWTKQHSHSDALRIMTKKLISDLWSEWRRASALTLERPIDVLPPPNFSDRQAVSIGSA